MEISAVKTKIVASQRKAPMCSKICIYNKIIEQVHYFKYLGYYAMYKCEKYISEEILNYNRAVGIIIQVLKLNLVQIHTRIRVHRILA